MAKKVSDIVDELQHGAIEARRRISEIDDLMPKTSLAALSQLSDHHNAMTKVLAAMPAPQRYLFTTLAPMLERERFLATTLNRLYPLHQLARQLEETRSLYRLAMPTLPQELRQLRVDVVQRILGTHSASETFRQAKALDFSSSFYAARSLEKHYRELFAGLTQVARPFQGIPAFASLSLAAGHPRTAFEAIDALNAEIAEVEVADTPPEPEALVRLVDDFIDGIRQALEAATSKVEARAVARLVLYLLPFIFSWYLAQVSSLEMKETQALISEAAEDGRMLDDQLAAKIGGLSEKLDDLIEETHDKIFYIVRYPVPLNKEQRYWGGDILMWLAPGQEVEVIERAGKWLRVAALNYDLKQTQVGWVLKKYLTRAQ